MAHDDKHDYKKNDASPAVSDPVYRQIVITLPLEQFAELTPKLYKSLDSLGITYAKLRTIRELGIVPIELAPDQDVRTVLAQLNELPDVNSAEQNSYLATTGTLLAAPPIVNDPLYRFQWALFTIGADVAWQHPAPASPVIVAILDTGISTAHPDLVPHLWDDGTSAGNHGFNVLTWTNDVEDEDGHGTLLAGTIAAVSNNAVGIAGTPWPVKLMAVKFHDILTRPDALHATVAIVWAVTHQANVINAAWHMGLPLGFVRLAIEFANAHDVVFVAGAGNDGLDNDVLKTYPASFPVANVVSVMATNEHDSKPGFSNYGWTTVHLAAPGVRMLSTDCYFTAPRWRNYSGTSAACALVANAAAVLKAMNPSWTPPQIRNHLIASVDKIPRWLPCIAEGRLNLARAVRGPLAITQPLANDVWLAGSTRQVAWSQAYVSPPTCATVRVLLSDNGGATYPTVLASGTLASALKCSVTAPNQTIANARIKLESEQGPGLFNESGVFKVKP